MFKMLFNEIKPYIRFARYMNMDRTSTFSPNVPYDARLFYVAGGNGIIKIDDKEYEMKKSSLLIINSGVEYHLVQPQHSVTYIAVNFDYTFNQSGQHEPIEPDITKNYDSTRLIENVAFSDIPEFDTSAYIENMQSVESDLIKLEKEYTKKLILHELKCSSLMTNILTKCYRKLKTQMVFDGNGDIADEIITYIHDNYNQNLSNQTISELFSYHPNYISSMIKHYTGLPLHQYLLNIKISKATEMLSEGDRSISSIAQLCGFYDVCHFSRCFKNIIGMSPREYLLKYK